MKRYVRALAAALTVALLAGGAYALSSGDSLITLSYLRDTFLPKAVEAGEETAEKALRGTYDQAKEQLDAAEGGTSGQDGGLYSATLQQREWSDGETIALSTGGGFLMAQGSASVGHDGAVIDVTDGTEIPSGSALVSGHRYLVGEGTRAQITILSGCAGLGVQGNYTVVPGREDPTPFYDVSRTDWYYESVNYAYSSGLFSGLEEHRFGANAPMTRAMLMTVLYRLAGAPQDELSAADVVLSDVPEDIWYAPYVKWGVSQNIASGTGDGGFTPDGQVTREQLVVLLYSFASNYLGMEMGTGADLSPYEDLNQASLWAADALSWAVAQGIISSSSEQGMFLSPQRSASRAEVAAMLRAFAEKI